MAVGIYKKGQGYWTRVVSTIALGLLIVMGLNWIWGLLSGVTLGENEAGTGRVEPVYVQATAAIIAATIAGVLGYYFLGLNRRFVDFLISTEGEMKKVNWSSKREVFGSTKVVILLTLFIALLCFGLDRGFAALFIWIKVLDTT